jgi:hypothetical protein
MLLMGIWYLIMSLLGMITSWLPGFGDVPLLLPWGTDGILIQMVSGLRGASSTFPYINALINSFIVTLTFELGLLTMKLVLGARTPTNDIK